MTATERFILRLLKRLCGALRTNNKDGLKSCAGACYKEIEEFEEMLGK
jgi:hypothetical protein